MIEQSAVHMLIKLGGLGATMSAWGREHNPVLVDQTQNAFL